MNLEAQIIVGDNRETLKQIPAGSVNTCITSPPYWGLRDYDNKAQLGQEVTPEQFIQNLVQVFREVRRTLTNDGTLWLNLGDTYWNKQLTGIPWRTALALQADGWILRSDIIWHKPNTMPESVTDRPTKAHEHIFLLAKTNQYFYDAEAIREDQSPYTVEDLARRKTLDNKGDHGGTRKDLARSRDEYVPEDGKRNKRDVWTVNTRPYSGAHFATYPPELILPCVLAGSKEGDTILDPFNGSGTTGEVALKQGRNYIGLELNPDYANLAHNRISKAVGMFGTVTIKP